MKVLLITHSIYLPVFLSKCAFGILGHKIISSSRGERLIILTAALDSFPLRNQSAQVIIQSNFFHSYLHPLFCPCVHLSVAAAASWRIRVTRIGEWHRDKLKHQDCVRLHGGKLPLLREGQGDVSRRERLDRVADRRSAPAGNAGQELSVQLK